MSSVLIIEDNLLLCKMEQRQISAAFPEISLRAVHNSVDALQAAKDEAPDAVVMDCRLPGCGCLELLDGILAVSPSAAIIIASADPPKDLRCPGYRDKVFDVLEKPFEAEELINVLRKAVSGALPSEHLRAHPNGPSPAKIRKSPEAGGAFDRHEMINILSGIYVGIRAFEADLVSASENSESIRETIAEYVPKILQMVERASARVKQRVIE